MAAKKKKKVKKAKRPVTSQKSQTASFTQQLLEELNKGQDTPAQLLGSDGKAIKIRGVISTQCVTLDRAIGRGGIPLSRITILHGLEGSGKSTVALHCVAEAQARGGMAVYMDAEHKLDPDYAKTIGVDCPHLVIVQPDFLESGFEKMEGVLKIAGQHRKEGNTVPILIVLDSIDALIAKAAFDGTWVDKHYAPEAQVWSRLLPKLVPMLDREDVALLLISQIREKIGVIYGKKEKTSGGHAPRFYSSLFLEVKKKKNIMDGSQVVGNHTEVYIGKNQIAPPFKTAEFKIYYGKGIDYNDSLLQAAVECGVVELAGSVYKHNGKMIGRGEAGAVKKLGEDPELVNTLLKEIENV